MKKPIRFFAVENDRDITEIQNNKLLFEDGMENFKEALENL